MLPLAADAAGNFQGIGLNPDAYRYCGRANAPGLRVGYAGDDVLRYDLTPEETARTDPWYADRVGEPARPEHFQAGQAARVTWRSAPPAEAGTKLVFLVLKLDRTPEVAPDLDRGSALGMLWQDFAAFAAPNTLFCCLLTWHTDRNARVQDRWDLLFDPCHGTSYDPYQLVPTPTPTPTTS